MQWKATGDKENFGMAIGKGVTTSDFHYERTLGEADAAGEALDC